MMLAIVTLFVVLLLVASIEIADSIQQAFTLARSLLSEASYVFLNTLARTLQNADPPHTPHGHEIPDLHPIDYVALTLWGGLFFPVIVACLVYLQCAQFWAKVWDDRAGRASQGRQVRRHTNYGVSSAAPALADGGWLLSYYPRRHTNSKNYR